MKTYIFLIIVLTSGASAGLVYGTVNYLIVEPYLDQATELENRHLFESGQAKNTPDFQVNYEGYRVWQKSGQILGGVIYGMSVGSLFGIVYAMSRNSLPGNHDLKKSLVLAGVMWLTLYLIPFLKYPANPAAVGDSETVLVRTVLYVSFIAVSGAGALAFYKLSKRFKGNKKFLAAFGYAVFISALFVAMPENPDEESAPMNLIYEFRLMSAVAVTSFWISVGIILGLFWNRLESQDRTVQHDYSDSLE